jgi:hypothetical protein
MCLPCSCFFVVGVPHIQFEAIPVIYSDDSSTTAGSTNLRLEDRLKNEFIIWSYFASRYWCRFSLLCHAGCLNHGTKPVLCKEYRFPGTLYSDDSSLTTVARASSEIRREVLLCDVPLKIWTCVVLPSNLDLHPQRGSWCLCSSISSTSLGFWQIHFDRDYDADIEAVLDGAHRLPAGHACHNM